MTEGRIICHLNFDSVLSDPEMGAGEFTILRKTWTQESGVPRMVDLEEIHAIDTVPDIGELWDDEQAAILALYRAGILNGVDAAGSFAPEKTLTRAEAAAMVARVLDPALRLR